MEANEAGELKEHAEHVAHDPSSRPIAFTMSVLAVLVAIVTVLGHRTHTEAVLNQNRSTDQWNLYQAKKIRSGDTQLVQDLLTVISVSDGKSAAAEKIAKSYADKQAKWVEDLKEEEAEARKLEDEVKANEKRAGKLDLGEALLEIALVTSSITLLTKNRMYWLLGLVFGIGGILVSGAAFLM